MKTTYKQEYRKSVLILSALIILVGAFFYWINKPATMTICADKAPVAPLVTPQPTITPKVVPMTVQDKIANTFGVDSIMNHVAFCESSFNPSVKHKTSSAKGLFQIIDGTWKSNKCTGDPLNADDNIKCAKKIYDRQELGPWQASRGCWGV